ncbi:MAG: VOC family protein [Vicinamibacterales bacterium]
MACVSGSVLIAQAPAGSRGAGAAVIAGLDHIPIAVNDLEQAADDYRALGFALKPGRPHDNGIRNQHVKFPDVTELELITAPAASDRLTTTYRRHLEKGDGPAFLAFFVPSRAAAIARLDAAKISHRHGDLAGALDYIFLGPRNQSPTDRPEHFAHANGAESLISVWLAGADVSAERTFLIGTGATFSTREVRVPDPVRADVAQLPEGTVVLLPASRQVLPGRPIVGATLRVADLAVARRAVEKAAGAAKIIVTDRSLFLPPSVTHGLWIELRKE